MFNQAGHCIVLGFIRNAGLGTNDFHQGILSLERVDPLNAPAALFQVLGQGFRLGQRKAADQEPFQLLEIGAVKDIAHEYLRGLGIFHDAGTLQEGYARLRENLAKKAAGRRLQSNKPSIS
jgi:hypothetical protein